MHSQRAGRAANRGCSVRCSVSHHSSTGENPFMMASSSGSSRSSSICGMDLTQSRTSSASAFSAADAPSGASMSQSMVEDGAMVFHDWAHKKDFLPLLRFLKTDAAEAEIHDELIVRVDAGERRVPYVLVGGVLHVQSGRW